MTYTTLLLTLALLSPVPTTQRIHSVSDISQQFSFYMDGRFARQYLRDEDRDVRNWGSLHKLDLSNANLLILTSGNYRVPYTEAASKHIAHFLHDGGAVLVMTDWDDPIPPVTAILGEYGATLLKTRVTKPLKGLHELSDCEITFRRGSTLQLSDDWTPLIIDANEKPILAKRAVGQGTLVVGSRGLFGHKPDASDPINAEWVQPLLIQAAATKKIDPDAPHRRTWAEHTHQSGPLIVEYHDGTQPMAAAIVDVYKDIRPHLLEITGVEPAPGMLKRLLVLPTGGGGFSSGARIAIGAWWGGFPEHRYPMVELIAHEATHSWVLPHPEPVWNEPIATYIGMLVGRRMQLAQATQRMQAQIDKARALDPDLTVIDPMDKDAPRHLIWGKTYFIFEQLEATHGPGAIAKYFQAKRAHVSATRPSYTMHDCVAIWSRATGEDLFSWFQSYGFSVDPKKTNLWPPESDEIKP
ncbi:MAG: hypothetical protein MK101_07490 [Phycisphaerales bacterium]|nr:hypothetical protein [Phycisphaerales bacterium]